MSVKIMAEVWELDLPQNEKFVLLAFADHADDAGRCFPSIARVAWKTGYKERQVRRVCAKLHSSGLLESAGCHDGGRGRARIYRVRTEKGVKMTPFSGLVRRSSFRETLSSRTANPDIAMTPQPSLTVIEPSKASGQKADRSVGMISGRNGSGMEPFGGSGLFKEIKEQFINKWRERFRSKPTWSGKDYAGLARILGQHPELDAMEFLARWDRFLHDNDPFIERQGHSLAFFSSRFDAYVARPSIDLPEATPYED